MQKILQKKTGAVIVISGVVDIVADGQTAYCVYNGHPMMGSVTGIGCQLSALTAAFISTNSKCPLEATLAAVCFMGICGEKAFSRLKPEEGSGTYRVYLMDAVSLLTGEELERFAKYKKV